MQKAENRYTLVNLSFFFFPCYSLIFFLLLLLRLISRLDDARWVFILYKCQWYSGERRE